MKKTHWQGSHYQAGYAYGKELFRHGINPLAHIVINQARREFAHDCLPIYKKYYPEILEEIKGMSDGLKISSQVLQEFLFTMYSHVFDNKCSCLAVKSGKKTFLARNSDFQKSVADFCDSTFYQLDNGYDFIGNTTAWTQMEDGVNDQGLAVGLTFISPTIIKPGLNAGMLVRYMLEKCATVAEGISFLKEVPISSPQTITLANKTGDIALVECNCEKVVILPTKNEVVYTTNHFTSLEMIPYQTTMPDDIHSAERYHTMKKALSDKQTYDQDYLYRLLKGEFGFMCQYDSASEMDTVWSAIYSLGNQLKVFKTEGNPSRHELIEDKRLNND